MAVTVREPYEDSESFSLRWLLIFLLLSLLAHAVIIAIIFLLTHFLPVPKIKLPEEHKPITLSLLPTPANLAPKPIFIPTTSDPLALHKKQVVVSANDHELTTKNQKARKPDSILPDVTGKKDAPDLTSTPNLQTLPPKPEVSSTPPTPKPATPQKPTPPQPKTQQAEKPEPQPNSKPPSPTPPPKTPPVDPVTGLPVLPPLHAQTLAQQTGATQPLAPAPSQPQQAGSVIGAVGLNGVNSPASMATVLGRYKQKVYNGVGSRWYPKVDKAFQILGVGLVHIQFTIYQDGTVTTKVLDAGNNNDQTLLSISQNAIREAALFPKFDDYPGLREELIKTYGGDGTSYTDDFTFSIYGR